MIKTDGFAIKPAEEKRLYVQKIQSRRDLVPKRTLFTKIPQRNGIKFRQDRTFRTIEVFQIRTITGTN